MRIKWQQRHTNVCVCLWDIFLFCTISQVMQTAFTCSLIACRELLFLFFSPRKVRRTWFCNYSSGTSDWRKHSSCFMFVSPLSQLHIQRGIFISNAHQCISEPPRFLHLHFPLPLVCFNFLLTWLYWHTSCCFPWGCYQWAICVLLLGLASCLSALRHSQPHIVTISLCPWASANPEGHRPFRVSVCVCVYACVFPQVSETLEKLRFLSDSSGFFR